jgi:hypothetical protein
VNPRIFRFISVYLPCFCKFVRSLLGWDPRRSPRPNPATTPELLAMLEAGLVQLQAR